MAHSSKSTAGVHTSGGGSHSGGVMPATYNNILTAPIGTLMQQTKTGKTWTLTQKDKDYIQQLVNDKGYSHSSGKFPGGTKPQPEPQPDTVPDTPTRPTGAESIENRISVLEGQVAELMKRLGNRNFDPEAAGQRLDMANSTIDHWDQQIADVDAQIAEVSNPMSPNYDKARADDLMKVKQQYESNRSVAAADKRQAKKNYNDYSAQTGNWAVGVNKFPLTAMQQF